MNCFKQIMEQVRKHDKEITESKEQHKLILNDYDKNLLSEKGNNKKINLEKDSVTSNLNESNNKVIKLEDELKFLNLSNGKKLQFLEVQIKELNSIKENIEKQLEQERLRYKEINSENADLREKKKQT